jgi:hypothetical protein
MVTKKRARLAWRLTQVIDGMVGGTDVEVSMKDERRPRITVLFVCDVCAPHVLLLFCLFSVNAFFVRVRKHSLWAFLVFTPRVMSFVRAFLGHPFSFTMGLFLLFFRSWLARPRI